ncbi:MFS transporter [Chloroflexota bacterium]
MFLKNKIFYGWVVTIATFFIAFISIGIRYCFGAFFNSLEDEFELTRVATSAIFSSFMVVSAIFSILGGWALDKYGPRKVIFIMGIFTGLSLRQVVEHTCLSLFLDFSWLKSSRYHFYFKQSSTYSIKLCKNLYPKEVTNTRISIP